MTVKRPVNCDVSEKDLADAKRQFEEEKHWQMKNPARQTLIEAIDNAISFLEGLRNDLRDK